MEVKQGYKQTDIGIIPNDWEIKNFGEIVDRFVNGGTPSTSKAENWIGKIPWITGADILDKKVGKVRRFISKEALKYSSTNIVGSGNLLIVSRTGVGKIAIAPFDIAISQDFTGVYLNKQSTNTEYIFQLLDFRQDLLKSQNQGTSIQGITRDTLSSFKIPLPPTKAEQTAIAQVLSDTDELISSLEKLIEKKKLIKQGTMQQLLTGKKRLPGFSGEWEMERLGNLGAVYGGLSGKSKIDFENGDTAYIPFLNIMNNPVIDVSYFDYVKIESNENQNKAMKGDLFFNGSSETPEEVGMCSFLMDDVSNLYLNSFCFGFRLFPERKTNGLYLSYFFRSSIGRKLFYTLAQGATRHNLSKTSFLKIEFPIPTPDEQVAISNLISDMESEIKSLEQKLNKYKTIKQGMMQNLLTGKIRLV